VLGNESAAQPKNGSLYTEEDWNDTSSIKNNEAYWLSKVHSVIRAILHCSLHHTTSTNCFKPSTLHHLHVPAPLTVLQVSAERQAWKIAKEHGLGLVTILPNFNLGPALSRQETKGLSVGFMKVSLANHRQQYTVTMSICIACHTHVETRSNECPLLQLCRHAVSLIRGSQLLDSYSAMPASLRRLCVCVQQCILDSVCCFVSLQQCILDSLYW